MPRELQWSWTIEDTRKALNKYNVTLPDWMKYPTAILGLGGLLYIFNLYIIPMDQSWLLYIIAAPPLLLIFFMVVIFGIKHKKAYGDGWYIKIYSDEISINLEDVCGNYDLNNISIESLTVKYITYWSYAGVGPVKGLYFKTINPSVAIKAPLVILLPRHVRELKYALQTLKQTNIVAA